MFQPTHQLTMGARNIFDLLNQPLSEDVTGPFDGKPKSVSVNLDQNSNEIHTGDKAGPFLSSLASVNLDPISNFIKSEVQNADDMLDTSIYSEMEPVSRFVKSEIKEETNLDHSVSKSGKASCDLRTEVEEITKNKSLYVDAISSFNSAVTGLDSIHVAEGSCTNKSNKQNPSEFVMESVILSAEDRPSNVLGEQDSQMQGRKIGEQSTEDRHGNLHKEQILQTQSRLQDLPMDLSQVFNRQSAEEKRRNLLREQVLLMRRRAQDLRKPSRGFNRQAVGGHRNLPKEQDSQTQGRVRDTQINPNQSFNNRQLTEDSHRNLLQEQISQMRSRIRDIPRGPSQSFNTHEQIRPSVSHNPTWASTWLFGSERRLQHYFGVSRKELLDSQTKLGEAYHETMKQKHIYGETRSRNQAGNMESTVKQDSISQGHRAEHDDSLDEKSDDETYSDDDTETPIKAEIRNGKILSNGAMVNSQQDRQILPLCEVKCNNISNVKTNKAVDAPQKLDIEKKGECAYTCDTCNRSFKERSKLFQHMITHEIDRKTYKCRFCPKELLTIDGQKRHEIRHTGARPYKCDKCSKCFERRSHLQRHKLDEHNADYPFLCTVCGKSFRLPEQYKKHFRIHMGEKNFVCCKCNKPFITLYNLQRHEKTHQSLSCDICSAVCGSRNELARHKMTHNKKAYQCDQCEASFDQNCNLTKHKVIHLGLKPYKCHMCDSSYAHRSNLNKHLRSAHNLTPKSEGWVGLRHPVKLKSSVEILTQRN